MLTKMYSIYDLKAQAFNTPFFTHNDEMAMRIAADAAMDNKTIFNRHPEDFVLYLVGSFDDQKGEAKGFSPAVHVAAFAELMPQEDLPLIEPKDTYRPEIGRLNRTKEM